MLLEFDAGKSDISNVIVAISTKHQHHNFIVYFSHDIDTWFVLSRYSVLQLESE